MSIFSCEKCDGGVVNTAHSNECNLCGKSASIVEIKQSPPVFKFYVPSDCTGYGYGRKGLRYYGILRYAEGRWIPDDGEPDLAFVGYTQGGWEGGAPIWYGVELPFENAFHPNKIAYESACRKCCEINSCGSGRTVMPDQCKLWTT